MRKKYKALFLMTVIFLCFVFQTKYIFAASTNFPGLQSNSQNNENNSNPDDDSSNSDAGPNASQNYNVSPNHYICRYNRVIESNTSVSINAYDLSGTSVIPYTLTPSTTFKAGTWIGINATEIKSVSWSASEFEDYEIQKQCVCNYSKDATTKTENKDKLCGRADKNPTCPDCNIGYTKGKEYIKQKKITSPSGKITVYQMKYINCYKTITIPGETHTETKTVAYEDDCDCPTWEDLEPYQTDITYPEVSTDTDISQCHTDAITDTYNAAKARVGGATNELRYHSANDIADENTIFSAKAKKGDDSGETGGISVGYGTIWQDYLYEPEKVCINVKTSEVFYDTECVSNQEIKQINNGTIYDQYLQKNITYWKYFIPLNTKTGTLIPIQLVKDPDSSEASLSKGQCEQAMIDYDNYEDLIVPNDGTYIGDYKRLLKNSDDYTTLQNDDSCNIAITVNFETDQKFYGEKTVNGTKKLSGYAFYYRPIDINNPFPNGVESNSYWYDWNNLASNRKNPNLLNSFNNISYKIGTINTNAVRLYKNNNPYNSWQYMNVNGSSSFVSTYNMRQGTQSYYKLGCGPTNADWEECKS